MANDTELERKQLQVFCGGAGEQQTSVFGTMKNPDPDYSKDPETLQGTNWPQGWQNAIAADDAPFMEDMNSLFYVLSYMTKYLYQHGIPDWNDKETYTALKSVVLRNGKFYVAKQTTGADNPQDPATDASFTYWYMVLDSVNPPADQKWVTDFVNNAIKNSVTPGNIGDIKYSALTVVPPGGAWCDGAEYTQAMFPDIYQMLVDGKLQSLSYSEYTNRISTNGYCEFLGFDSTTQKFKVPTLPDKYVIDTNATAPVLGNGLNLGMTDGTILVALQGGSSSQVFTDTRAYGANIGDTSYSGGSGITTEHGLGITTDASKSGIIADTSATGKLAKLKAYVVLYATAAGANEAQAQEFMTALGGKANVGLDNITAEAKDLIAGLGMTSTKYIDIDPPKNQKDDEFIAPSNGLVYFGRRGGVSNATLSVENKTTGIWDYGVVNNSNEVCCAMVDCQKGHSIYLKGGSANGELIGCRFYYAEGSKE